MTKPVEPSQTASEALPLRLHLDRVDGRCAGSLYEFVRRTLAAHGGACTRAMLLEAIGAGPAASERLKRTKGFAALLGGLKSSGFVEFDGDLVRRTNRRYGSRRP